MSPTLLTATCLQTRGDLDGAITEYRELARLDPGSAALKYISLSSALWTKGDFDGALAAAREATRLAPDSAPAHVRLGVAHVGESWSHVSETFAGNVLGTHHVFDGVRRAGLAPRVLITSSATVYSPLARAITENDVVRPNSPYGTSKVAQEMLGQQTKH